MAFKKQCDFEECGKTLGESEVPFFQLHGSMSEQIEPQNGPLEYRYLTPHARAKMTFCDNICLVGWIEQEKRRTPFTTRTVIHRESFD